LPGLFFEDLTLDQSAQIACTVTAADVEAFAAVSGDDNPLHLDEAYAATTPFKRRIAHGMLTGAYISAVLGTRLPGPGSVYVSQNLRFRRPVGIGDEVTTTVTVRALDARRGQATLATVCSVAGKTVVDGEAVVALPKREA
jgi:3-hydroxybutyryl-CoA dehydratase